MTAFGLLGVALVLLKLVGIINISWWFVLMPFYLPIVVWLAFAMLFVLLQAAIGRW